MPEAVTVFWSSKPKSWPSDGTLKEALNRPAWIMGDAYSIILRTTTVMKIFFNIVLKILNFS